MARAKKRRRVRGVLRPYARAMRGGREWWWCAVPGKGRVALGIPCDGATLEEATRLACERYAAGALAPRAAQGAEESTLAEVILAFARERSGAYKPRTWQSMENRLTKVEEWYRTALGVTLPSKVTDEAVSKWLKARQAKAENATINRDVLAARVVFRWARAREPALCGRTALERTPRLREIGRQTHAVVPSPEEWRGLVAELLNAPCNPRFIGHKGEERHRANCLGVAQIVASAVETGMRFDELRHQRPQDVRATAVIIAAHDGWSPKSWHERTVPVAKETATLLRQAIAWRDKARGLNGKALVLGEHYVNDRIAEAWKRAELPGDPPTMHDARRTFATASVRAGAGLDRVRVLLGHRDVSTTERYVGRYRTDAEAPIAPLGVAAVLEAKGRSNVVHMTR